MTDEREIERLSGLIRGMGGMVARQGDEITITGVAGVGPHPMPLIAAAERMRQVVSSKTGAAILGFRGAIRCCRAVGLDERRVFELVCDHGSE
jgi:hypothetical protein